MQRRASTLEEAGRIIDAEAALLDQWIETRRHHDLLKQYQEKVSKLKDQVLEKNGISQWPVEQQEKAKTMAHQISKKIAHVNMVALKQVIESGNHEHIELLASLFDLEINDEI